MGGQVATGRSWNGCAVTPAGGAQYSPRVSAFQLGAQQLEYTQWVRTIGQEKLLPLVGEFQGRVNRPLLRAMGNALYHPVPMGWFVPFALSTNKWLNDAGVPVLVMHGKRDVMIPFAFGVQLYDDLRVLKQMAFSKP